MKRYLALAALALAPLAYAQNLKLEVFDRLKDKASDTTDINLNKDLITAAGIAFPPDFIKRLESVLVKSLTFEKSGVFTEADVKQLNSELSGPGWNLIVNVTENKGKEVSRIWVKKNGDEFGGFRVLAAENNELTVVEILGKVSLLDLKNLDALGVSGNIASEHGKSDKKKDEE